MSQSFTPNFESHLGNFAESFLPIANPGSNPFEAGGSRNVNSFTDAGIEKTYAKGNTIVHMMGLGNRAYVVTSGEVAIYVNGLPVDLIEAGEYFDESIWLGGYAVALTDCVLRSMTSNQLLPVQH